MDFTFRSKAKSPLRGGLAFLFVRPAGRTHLEVEILYLPDRGKCWSDGKDAHCDWI